MKKIIVLMSAVLMSVSTLGQSNEEYLLSELERLESKLRNTDTMGVREALKRIAPQCEASTEWIIPFKYNKNYGSLEIVFRKSEATSIPYLRKAYDLFPSNVAANYDFMEVADYLACAYHEIKQYDSAERVAADAVLRGASLNDSVPFSVDLFFVLADCYQQRGDTIMPQYFHQKSQQLSILQTAYTYMPDSVERVYNRFYTMNNIIEQERVFFTKDHPVYLFLLKEYLGWMSNTGNIEETVWLGEQILQIARDSALDMEPQLFDTYLYLLYAYAGSNKMDKCKDLLPYVKRSFSIFAKHPDKDGILYYYIACGLMDDIRYEEAINYFDIAKKRMDKELLKKYRQDINDRIAFCNEKKGFGKYRKED